ncbi:MAG: cupin-like domain-containing protein [Hyphomonas sp.]|uniref:cupin-like domain-containing protein n=1 Tax=Hyphomonas sp. TaxID=87 RepID=UPI003527052B
MPTPIDLNLPTADTFHDVTPKQFQTAIRPAGRPSVLKGAVSHWPVVQASRTSVQAAAEYILGFDNGTPVPTVFGSPEIQGRFFYSDDLKGLNFHKRSVPLGAALAGLVSQIGAEHPGSIYVQSIPVQDHIPGFEAGNSLPFLRPDVLPRIWIGNQITVQTHFDLFENIACVAAGKRRFTLFPPDQIANIYPGPFEHTLSGPPVSMVRLEAVDQTVYPRFNEALDHAVVADLEPGDCIYIPYGWWHHVQSLEPFNILVNYWWNDAPGQRGSAFDAMLHALLTIRDLPPQSREAWKSLFDHYVFQVNGDPVAHLPRDAQGALGPHSDDMAKSLWQTLAQAITYAAKEP